MNTLLIWFYRFYSEKKAECGAGRKILFSFVENCDKINPLSVKKIIDFWIIEYLLDIAVVLDRNSNIAAFLFCFKMYRF